MKKVPVKKFFIGKKQPLTIFSGPCVIESEDHCLRAAERLKQIFSKHKIQFIFKSSYDKANRLSSDSFRGPGLDEGLRILQRVKSEWDLPVVTDVHSPEEAKVVGEVCDVLQIPAFLCRQTDIVLAAAKTGAVVQIKKGQFMAPWDMKNIVDKVLSEGNENIILVDRGTTFGYNNLVSDMRAIPIMQQFGFPVCFDATHSVQLPGGGGNSSGGQREFIPTLSKAAIASGVNALYLEAHPDPAHAKSDAKNVLSFEELARLLRIVERLYDLMQEEEENFEK